MEEEIVKDATAANQTEKPPTVDLSARPAVAKPDDYETSAPAPVVQEATAALQSFDGVVLGDCLEKLRELPEDSIDLIATDPPYGLKFMGKSWDRAVPSVDVWKECYRALKPGAFAFIMCSARQDCLARMIVNLEEAGFCLDFTSMYWTYAQGFPKAHNISKAIDKKLDAKREVLGRNPNSRENCDKSNTIYESGTVGKISYLTRSATEEAKKFEGAYGGFQPKPAVEVIIVAMKPMEEKTFVGQALRNGKGLTWMDDCRIPYADEADKALYDNRCSVNGVYETGPTWSGKKVLDMPKAGARTTDFFSEIGEGQNQQWSASDKGRFPANLLVSEDVLDDGKKRNQGHWGKSKTVGFGDFGGGESSYFGVGKKTTPDRYSRFFSLDAWAEKNLPFLLVSKPSKREKDTGLEAVESKVIQGRDPGQDERSVSFKPRPTPRRNHHPTVKPIKLMAYLIMMGSREGDLVLDPFAGSGSTCVAAKLLNRRFIGIEIDPAYHKIATRRVESAKDLRGFATLEPQPAKAEGHSAEVPLKKAA